MSFLSLYRPKLSLVAVQPCICLSIIQLRTGLSPHPFIQLCRNPYPRKIAYRYIQLNSTQLMEINHTRRQEDIISMFFLMQPRNPPPHLP